MSEPIKDVEKHLNTSNVINKRLKRRLIHLD